MEQAIRSLVEQEIADVEPNSTWTEQELVQFSQDTGYRIPARLAQYLQNIGTVFFEYPVFDIALPNHAIFTTELARIGFRPDDMIREIGQFEAIQNAETGEITAASRTPEGFFIIGEAEGKRTFLMMDSVNQDNPAVYARGLAYDAWGVGDNTLGLGYVANDLAEWLEQISSNPFRE